MLTLAAMAALAGATFGALRAVENLLTRPDLGGAVRDLGNLGFFACVALAALHSLACNWIGP